MPMIDAYIPEGALEANAENRLLEGLTDILIKHEGLDPADQRVRAVTWIFLHRPKIYRAGTAARQAVYRITPAVPEGQYTDEARASLVKEVTEAVARARSAKTSRK
jgi:phenylpyruvate tautomerase PptA (4-oxalocrotonate tautomerase family)